MRITYAVALFGAALTAEAQDSTVRAPIERATSRHLLVGDLAVEIRSPTRGAVLMGFADERQSVSLEVRATDARRWADSVRRLLALRPPPRPRATAKGGGRASAGQAKGRDTVPVSVRRVRAVLEEPGVGAGSLLLTRIDSAGTIRWALYGADGDLSEVREELEPSEARVIANVVRTAAIAAAPPPMRKGGARKQKATAKPKPAAKPSPAARPPTTARPKAP